MNIEEAKEVLRKAGYYVDNLWHVDDIRNNGSYDSSKELSDEQCLYILGDAIADSYSNEQGYEWIAHELDSYYERNR